MAVILDHIEWDDHNLHHATQRLTASEIEQALWNADRKTITQSRHAHDRWLVRSVTNGGKRVLVVIRLQHQTARPITGWEE